MGRCVLWPTRSQQWQRLSGYRTVSFFPSSKKKLHFPSSCPSSVFVSSSSLQFPVHLNLFSISALSASSQCLHHLFHLFSAKNIYKAQKPNILLHLNLFSVSSISSQQNDAQSLKPQNSSSSQSLIHLFNLFFFIFSTSKNNVQNPEP